MHVLQALLGGFYMMKQSFSAGITKLNLVTRNIVFTSQALSDELIPIVPPKQGFAQLSSELREVAE